MCMHEQHCVDRKKISICIACKNFTLLFNKIRINKNTSHNFLMKHEKHIVLLYQ